MQLLFLTCTYVSIAEKDSKLRNTGIFCLRKMLMINVGFYFIFDLLSKPIERKKTVKELIYISSDTLSSSYLAFSNN